ncbi:MAG: hypothetical protein EXQ92_01885 [Alphaproteobacteria bacterium]|nr:hypothetical protein [Alphaproteobacteria bacterium]
MDQFVEAPEQPLEWVARSSNLTGAVNHHSAIGGDDSDLSQIDATRNVVSGLLQLRGIVKPRSFAQCAARKSDGSAADRVGICADPSDDERARARPSADRLARPPPQPTLRRPVRSLSG